MGGCSPFVCSCLRVGVFVGGRRRCGGGGAGNHASGKYRESQKELRLPFKHKRA